MTKLVAWLRGEIGRATALYAAVGVIAAACLAYANSLDGGFHYDDGHHIVANPFLRSLDYVDDYFTRPDMFSALPDHEMYRPVLLLTFALNYHWGGYDPLPWRLTALALHAFCAVGVFLTIRILCVQLLDSTSRSATGVGFVAALFFALHPVFTETVNYASARSSLLATALMLWAFYCHRKAAAFSRAGVRTVLWTLSLALFGLALLSKEIAIVFPALLFWLAWQERRGFLAVLPSLLVAVLYLHFARGELLGSPVIDFAAREAAAQAAPDPALGGGRPMLWNLFTQARVVPAYVALFILPAGLCVDRYVRVSETPWEAGVVLGVILIVALLVAAWRLRHRRPLVSLGLTWFFLALAPTSSVIPLNVVMNEHRLYLPGIGVEFLVAALLRRGGLRPWLVGTLAVVACVVTMSRNRDWRDSYRLWESTVAVSPQSPGAWNSLGVQRGARGEFEGAVEAYQNAIRLNPRAWNATFNMGTLQLRRGRETGQVEHFATAERWLNRSLEIEPRSQRSRWYRAEVWWEQDRRDEARSAFHELASESARLYEMTRFPLAKMALDEGDYDTSEVCYRYVLKFGNDPVGAHLGLARLAEERGDAAEVVRCARAAMQARPHDPAPHIFQARRKVGTLEAMRHLFEAERRGYRASAEERRQIMGAAGP